jgi:tRNA (guanosine-2'-O-)-methyltransferase
VKRRRPVRFWPAAPPPVDPTELLGPRGLVPEIAVDEPALADLDAAGRAGQERDDAFWTSLFSEARRARIDSVVAARLRSLTCVLDRLIDPHNVAAVLRTAEGLGLCAVHVVPNDESDAIAHHRVTQDADKWLDLHLHRGGAEAARALAALGYSVYAGHLDERAVLLEELPADRPIALLFGNEHQGPTAETLAACAGTFKIPMAGFTQSFNVSVAAAIALSHAARARRAALGAAGDLSEADRRALRSRFYRLAAKLARRVPNAPELARK